MAPLSRVINATRKLVSESEKQREGDFIAGLGSNSSAKLLRHWSSVSTTITRLFFCFARRSLIGKVFKALKIRTASRTTSYHLQNFWLDKDLCQQTWWGAPENYSWATRCDKNEKQHEHFGKDCIHLNHQKTAKISIQTKILEKQKIHLDSERARWRGCATRPNAEAVGSPLCCDRDELRAERSSDDSLRDRQCLSERRYPTHSALKFISKQFIQRLESIDLNTHWVEEKDLS